MDIYHIWFDLKPGTDDRVFAPALGAFLDHMTSDGRIESWRMMRCKLGLKPDDVREFHIMIETRDLAQLDTAFRAAASRITLDQVEFTLVHVGADTIAQLAG